MRAPQRSRRLGTSLTHRLDSFGLCSAWLLSVALWLGPAAEAATLGDFNGDGFADLAVGAPNERVDDLDQSGSVTLIFGSSSGLDATTSQRITESELGEPDDFAHFGSAVAASDINGDGFDDLAIGVPDKDVDVANQGAVYILFGSAVGVETTNPIVLTQDDLLFNEASEKNDRFGSVIAVGDFNGDGVGDLAVGAPEENFEDDGRVDTNTGEVNVVYGSRTGGYSAERISRKCWTNGPFGEEWFGNALAPGDFNGDGVTDLAVGLPGKDVDGGEDGGELRVGYGESPDMCRTIKNETFRQNQSGVLGDSEDRDFFGDAVAAGDFDNDGFDDLAVGVPGESYLGLAKAGEIMIFKGTPSGLTSIEDEVWRLERPEEVGDPVGESARGDQFGSRLASGDFNGDGFIDLAIHVPGHDVGLLENAGAVSVLYGSSEGLTAEGSQLWTQDSPGMPGEVAALEFFGAALATGDVNNDGRDELFIGAPRDTVNGLANAGSVTLLMGSAAGLSVTGAEVWTQDLELVPGEAGTGNRFGDGLPGDAGKRWQELLGPAPSDD